MTPSAASVPENQVESSPKIPYHLQILGGFLILQGFVIIASFLIVNRTQTRQVELNIRKQLEVTREVFNSVLSRRNAQLAEALQFLGKDFAIRQAVATRDAATIASVALNLKERGKANLIWITDDQGRLYADTAQGARRGESVANMSLVSKALEGDAGTSVEILSGQPYQLAASPIEAPDVLGVLIAGFVIDDEFASELKRLTLSEISFEAGGKLVASTLTAKERAVLEANLPSLRAGGIHVIGHRGERHIVLAAPVAKEVTAYIQYAFDAALKPLRHLKRLLVLIGCVGFFLTALLGYLIAAGVTGSIRSLLGQLQTTNQELFQLNKFKDQFFSMVTHDVKNPLNTILCSLGMIKEEAKEPEAQRLIEPVSRAAKTLDFLISDLVDFAAIESGKLRINMGTMDLSAVADEIRERMEILAKQRNIQFMLKNGGPIPKLRGDPARMVQVLQNLCGNALQYTPAGGSVTLAVELVGDKVKVSVRDTGIGIAPEDLPKIFNRFFQASNARKMRNAGFGLGLKIANEIVRTHGGAIQVESQLGKGSTFFFMLPILPKEA